MFTGALLAGAAMFVIYFFAPEEHRFYPRCLFYSLTGVQCPGCGGLRAMHRLLHGEFAAAWHLNPIVLILFPVAAAWSLLYLFKRELAERCALLIRQPAFLWTACAAAVLFSVVRWVLSQ
jgi:hypothetical protein